MHIQPWEHAVAGRLVKSAQHYIPLLPSRSFADMGLAQNPALISILPDQLYEIMKSNPQGLLEAMLEPALGSFVRDDPSMLRRLAEHLAVVLEHSSSRDIPMFLTDVPKTRSRVSLDNVELEPEELAKRRWQQLEQWEKEHPRRAATPGYGETLLGVPSREARLGKSDFKQPFATTNYSFITPRMAHPAGLTTSIVDIGDVGPLQLGERILNAYVHSVLPSIVLGRGRFGEVMPLPKAVTNALALNYLMKKLISQYAASPPNSDLLPYELGKLVTTLRVGQYHDLGQLLNTETGRQLLHETMLRNPDFARYIINEIRERLLNEFAPSDIDRNTQFGRKFRAGVKNVTRHGEGGEVVKTPTLKVPEVEELGTPLMQSLLTTSAAAKMLAEGKVPENVDLPTLMSMVREAARRGGLKNNPALKALIYGPATKSEAEHILERARRIAPEVQATEAFDVADQIIPQARAKARAQASGRR